MKEKMIGGRRQAARKAFFLPSVKRASRRNMASASLDRIGLSKGYIRA